MTVHGQTCAVGSDTHIPIALLISCSSPETILTMVAFSQDNIPSDPYWLYPCAICYRTIPEIYKGSEGQYGLKRDDVSPNRFKIPRL